MNQAAARADDGGPAETFPSEAGTLHGPARGGGRSAEIRAERDDPHVAVLAEREHRAVAGYDELCVRGKRTLEDSVVRFIREHRERLGWFDDLAKVGEEDGDAGELLPVTGEFTCKDGEELVEDGLGERERVLAFDDSAYRLIAAPPPAG